MCLAVLSGRAMNEGHSVHVVLAMKSAHVLRKKWTQTGNDRFLNFFYTSTLEFVVIELMKYKMKKTKLNPE